MRVFVSADIEGVCGSTAWDEARKESPTYRVFRDQMAAETAAACAGAVAAGATSVVVKDAHGDARNLLPADLPEPARLVRAYNGHPFAMVQGLDATFDAAVFVGYHSRGGAGGNPLAHTLSSRRLAEVRVDGAPVSELDLHRWAAGSVGVPVAFVSGDEALCAAAEASGPGVRTFAVKGGEGASTTNLHPAEAVAGIRAGVEAALRGPLPPPTEPPPAPVLELDYVDHTMAWARAWYPGAELVATRTVRLPCPDHFELLRGLIFLAR